MSKLQKIIDLNLFCIGFLMLFSGISIAQVAENIEGEWEFSMSMGEPDLVMKSKAVFTITEDANITGTWEMIFEQPEDTQAPPAGGFERPQISLVDINVEGQTLTFTQQGNFAGNPFEMPFTGTIQGDQIEGVFSSQFGEIPVTAVRINALEEPVEEIVIEIPVWMADETEQAKDIVGDWEFTLSMGDMGQMNINSTISKTDDGQYAMTWEMDMPDPGMAGDVAVRNEDIKLDGDTLTFTHVISMGDMGEFQMPFSGTYDGDTITGALTSEMGNMSLNGTRKAQADPLIGDWVFTINMGDMGMEMTANSTISKSDDEQYAMTWESDTSQAQGMGGDVSIRNEDVKLDDNTFTFTHVVSMGDMGEFRMQFSGTLEGDTITGALNSDMGQMQVTGTRVIESEPTSEMPEVEVVPVPVQPEAEPEPPAETEPVPEPVTQTPASQDDPLTGDWVFKLNMADMGTEMTIYSVVSKTDDGQYDMTWDVVDSTQQMMGDVTVANEDIMLDGNTLSFTHIVSMDGAEVFRMPFSGTLQDGNITGAFTSDMGQMSLSGTRRAK